MTMIYLVTADFSDYDSADSRALKAFKDSTKAELFRLEMEEKLEAFNTARMNYNARYTDWLKDNPQPRVLDNPSKRKRWTEEDCASYNTLMGSWSAAWRKFALENEPHQSPEFADISKFYDYSFNVEEIELDEEL